MAVGVETDVFLFPSTACCILGCTAPNPSLRQAARRYVQYTLVQWNVDGGLFLIFCTMQIIYIYGDDKNMKENNSNEKWSVYEANVQAYRSNFLSSQSLLLAVGAITLDKNIILTVFLSVIAIIQIWYIWFRPINVRTQIVDYYKYDMKNLFDKNGELLQLDADYSEGLEEYTYISDSDIRKKVQINMSSIWDRKGSFRTLRLTRIKFDIVIPVFMTLVWFAFIIYSFWA